MWRKPTTQKWWVSHIKSHSWYSNYHPHFIGKTTKSQGLIVNNLLKLTLEISSSTDLNPGLSDCKCFSVSNISHFLSKNKQWQWLQKKYIKKCNEEGYPIGQACWIFQWIPVSYSGFFWLTSVRCLITLLYFLPNRWQHPRTTQLVLCPHPPVF